MSRDSSHSTNRVALLATGDEITHGDILNTNSQIIAQKCFSHGIPVGLHMAVPDNVAEIENALYFLLKNHKAIIMTGGLGPTSDDITRYALSKVLDKPLVFDTPTWEDICERFKILGYKDEPPEGNRQQALFPEDAMILKNPSGTAAGCAAQKGDQLLFMLPGPPFECLPMFDHFVVSKLKDSGFQEIHFHDSWLLFGIGESMIAEQLDAAAKPFQCTTGYRLAYPYIEFKLYSNHEKDFQLLCSQVKKIIAPYLISDGKQTASAMLQKRLAELNMPLRICDHATGGLLQSTLVTPQTFSKCCFVDDSHTEVIDVIIEGLTEYWHNQNASESLLKLRFKNGSEVSKRIPLRGRENRVKMFAVEYICQQIFLSLAATISS